MKNKKALYMSVLAMTFSCLALGAPIGTDSKAAKVRTCVMDYVEKGAVRSKRSVEVFFKEEKKLVFITLNSCLKDQGMTEVDTSNDNLNAKLTYEKNVMGNELLGFSVEDGKKRYCFPCMYSDSAADWGILPANVPNLIRQPASELGAACPLPEKTLKD